MKIALYHAWIYGKGGGERIILELLKHSNHDITVFTNHYTPDTTYPEFRKYDIKVLKSLPIIGDLFRGISFSLLAAISKIPLEEYDALVISTGGVAEFILFRNHSKPTLGICLTPLRAAHDPLLFREKIKSKNLLSRNMYKLGVKVYKYFEKRAWKHFDRVLCISKNSLSRVLDGGLLEKNRTEILYPGADIGNFKPGKYEHYFLYPSRFSYHKRQELAINAFLDFKKKHGTDFKLMLAGGVNPESLEYFEKIKRMASESKDIIVRKDVENREWLSLYSNCYAVLFCALNEDWGIVPIEAGASKKPVISVDEGGPRESIKQGKTGLLVPARPDAFSDAMQRLVKNPKLAKKMGGEGLKESRKYSWADFVKSFDRKVERFINEKLK
ncbi:MAG: glycosyltransferase [Candidatus Aenigmarchaeota archaeon]|nr:glycosyltransferase [Candidatus Aenigmarchaeota archaeon]